MMSRSHFETACHERWLEERSMIMRDVPIGIYHFPIDELKDYIKVRKALLYDMEEVKVLVERWYQVLEVGLVQIIQDEADYMQLELPERVVGALCDELLEAMERLDAIPDEVWKEGDEWDEYVEELQHAVSQAISNMAAC